MEGVGTRVRGWRGKGREGGDSTLGTAKLGRVTVPGTTRLGALYAHAGHHTLIIICLDGRAGHGAGGGGGMLRGSEISV